MHYILYTAYSILHTPYSILYTLYLILYTLYSILYTPYSILHTPYSILGTPYYIVVESTLKAHYFGTASSSTSAPFSKDPGRIVASSLRGVFGVEPLTICGTDRGQQPPIHASCVSMCDLTFFVVDGTLAKCVQDIFCMPHNTRVDGHHAS